MSGGFGKLLLATTALVPLGASPVDANPLGASVVAGSATVQGQGTSNVTITQSTNSAIINWNTFNIGSGEKTTIIQPNATSVQLDRVTGGLGPSQILGSLSSNGRVFLVNPDGILFGKDAQVNVGGLLATTHDISNSDFMAGRYNFAIPGRSDASVVNQGTITAQTGGFGALVAPGVRNTGTITATLGKVGLAAANGFSLDLYGDRLITLQVGDQVAATVKDVATGKPLSSLVGNEGKIRANGGRVELTAAAARTVVDSVINNRGVIEANSIGKHNGLIVLGAATGAHKPAGAPVQVVKVSGKLSTAGKGKGETGGKIQITGENIQFANAMLDASGRAGGGKVLVGGDSGGGKLSPTTNAITGAALESTSVPTASQVSVDAASTINVSAIDSGNGGKAILWSDSATQFAGTILAHGGAQSGNGGFVETSSHGNLGFSGSVDIGAPKGLPGTLLLDPMDVTVGTSGTWIVTPSAIQTALASGNVIVSTAASGTDAGDIKVAQGVSWSNANSLTLSAYRNIAVNANITNTGGAAVNLRADSSGTGVGTVAFGSSVMISTSGAVSILYNPSVNPAGSVVNGTSYANPTENFAGHVTGGAQLTAYMLVNSVYDLQNIQNNISGNYALGKNIDASATAGWNGGAGFNPIGGINDPCASSGCFAGVIDGLGNTISGFTSNGGGINGAGLFRYVGASGVIRNVGVSGGVSGDGSAALLAMVNYGTISNSFTSGTVTGGAIYTGNVGGLVASMGLSGTISNSYSNATVTGSLITAAGGLVGYNGGGTVSGSYANGDVTGGINHSAVGVGGLVGLNSGGAITNSYANGKVSGSVDGLLGGVGGLVGVSSGTVSNSYANGSVKGNADVGGLVGWNGQSGAVINSYATGNVTGGGVGGLVGKNGTYSFLANSTIANSYATGTVTGTSMVGGLAGQNFGTISGSRASGNVTGSGDAVGGLVGYNIGSYDASTYYSGTVSNSYATGNVSGTNNVGGLVGFNGGIYGHSGTVKTSYANGQVSGTTNVGGLVGNNQGIFAADGTIQYGYWDITASGQSVGVGLGSGAGTAGLSTPQLKSALPSGFDPSVWGIKANISYPYLLWETVSPPPIPPTPNPPIILTGQSGAPPTIAIVAGADPETKTYGTSDPALTWHIVSGSLAAGDSFVGSPTRSSGNNVGTYMIGQGTLSLPATYSLTFQTALLTILPATLTYVANAASKAYGSANPSLSGIVTGFVSGDTQASATMGTFGVTTNATQSSNVGKYSITGSGLTANFGDYVFAQAASNTTALTINPAPLTVTANDAARSVGQQNPAFTASYSGFVLGQDKSAVSGLTYSTPANTSSPAGVYLIIPSGASVANYAITYVNGSLSVTSDATPTPAPSPTPPSSDSIPTGWLVNSVSTTPYPTGQISNITQFGDGHQNKNPGLAIDFSTAWANTSKPLPTYRSRTVSTSNSGVSTSNPEATGSISASSQLESLDTVLTAADGAKLKFSALSQLSTAKNSAPYGSLDPSKRDEYFEKSTVQIQSETCLAVDLTMIAIAVEAKGATVAEYWISNNPDKAHNNVANPQALQNLKKHTVELSSWGPYETPDFKRINVGSKGIYPFEQRGSGSAVDALKSGPILLGGYISSLAVGTEVHWMLGVGVGKDSKGQSVIIANDPWTGTKVMIATEGKDDVGKVTGIMDPKTGRYHSLNDSLPSDVAQALPTTPNGNSSYKALETFNALDGGFVTVAIK